MANLTDSTNGIGSGTVEEETEQESESSNDRQNRNQSSNQNSNQMPESGDDTTRRLRDNADSDPMRQQTEPENDRQAAERYRREVRESQREQERQSRNNNNNNSGNTNPNSGGRQTYDDIVSDETMRNTTGGSPGDSQGTGVEDVGNPAVRRQAQQLEQRVISETGAEGPGDVTVTQDGDRLNAELTFSGRNNVAANELGVDNTDISLQDGNIIADTKRGQEAINNATGRQTSDSSMSRRRAGPVNRPTLRAVGKEQVAAAASEQTGQNYTADDVSVTENADGSLEFDVRQKESFDMDWSFGFGGPEDEVEGAVDSAANDISKATDDFSANLFDEGTSGESGGSFLLRSAGRDDLAQQYDSGVRDFGRGFYSGAASIANVPGLIGGAMEGVETLNAGASSGASREFRQTAYDRGDAIRESVIDEATENPLNTAGMATGALVGSYGIMSTASRIGPRTGAAARYSIQPGEELAGKIGYQATKKASSAKTADKLFPNQEPLIFSEEAAIRGGQKLVSKTRNLQYQDAKARAQPSRLAQEAASARFKAEEILRSDAPTRMNADINTPVVNRLRTEAKSVQFKGAEARQKAGDALGGVRQRARAFNEDNRGQAQIPRSRMSSESEMDSVGPELESGAQQLEPPQSRVRSELESERVTGPELTRPESELQTRQTTRPFETNISRVMEPSISAGGSSLDVRTEMSQRSPLDTRTELEGPRSDLEIGRDTTQDTELDLGVDTGFDMRSDLETETEFASEFEMEFETELESEVEAEVEGFGLNGDFGARRQRRSSRSASATRLERDLLNPFTGE